MVVKVVILVVMALVVVVVIVVILVVIALVAVVVIVVILVVIALVAVVVMVILVVIALVLVVVIVAVLAGVVSYFVGLPWNRSTATGPHSQCEYKYINMYSITEFVYAYIEYVKDSGRKRDRES